MKHQSYIHLDLSQVEDERESTESDSPCRKQDLHLCSVCKTLRSSLTHLNLLLSHRQWELEDYRIMFLDFFMAVSVENVCRLPSPLLLFPNLIIDLLPFLPSQCINASPICRNMYRSFSLSSPSGISPTMG